MKSFYKKLIVYLTAAIVLAALIIVCIYQLVPVLTFKSIQEHATAETFAQDITPLKNKIDHTVWSHYADIASDHALNRALCQALQQSENADGFTAAFNTLVEEHYWQGYDIHIDIQTELSGHRGSITATGAHLPDTAYGILTTFGADGKVSETLCIPVVGGTGYYNLYGKDITKTTLYLAADKAGKQVLSATHTETVSPLALPEVFISELSNRHTITYYSDLENDGEQHRGANEQKFQYIELYNYSDKAVDLSNYSFVYTDQAGEHTFQWLTESDGALLLAPQKTFVIGVYAADTALAGLGYESDAAIRQYWQAFNEFYNTDIAIGQRVMIACVASGKSEVMLDGIDHLQQSSEAGITVSAEIRLGNKTVTKVSLPDEMPYGSYAYQFLPAGADEKEQAFLFTTGCFPGKILTEQHLDHCETPLPANTNIIKAVSYNILATNDNPAKKQGSVEYRSKLFFRFMKEYQPDIIGLQEVNFRWTPLLSKEMAALGYGEIQGISGEQHTYADINRKNQWDLMNPIYYRTDRYDLLESGYVFLTQDGTFDTEQWDSINRPKRTLTWAVLRDKISGKVLTHLNTHLVLSGKRGRVEQVKAICAKGDELQKKYGGGIVITGDHNMTEGSEPYQAYSNSGVVADTKYLTTDHNSIGSFTDFDTAYNKRYGAPIDFCFASDELAVHKYRIFGGRYSDGIISDHSAVLVELYQK